MKQLPDQLEAYRRTPVFTADTVPAGLLRQHRTKAGTWGKIVVLEGELLYRTLEPPVEEVRLRPGRPGIVQPQEPHEVEPVGAVRFYVEFYREFYR